MAGRVPLRARASDSHGASGDSEAVEILLGDATDPLSLQADAADEDGGALHVACHVGGAMVDGRRQVPPQLTPPPSPSPQPSPSGA